MKQEGSCDRSTKRHLPSTRGGNPAHALAFQLSVSGGRYYAALVTVGPPGATFAMALGNRINGLLVANAETKKSKVGHSSTILRPARISYCKAYRTLCQTVFHSFLMY